MIRVSGARCFRSKTKLNAISATLSLFETQIYVYILLLCVYSRVCACASVSDHVYIIEDNCQSNVSEKYGRAVRALLPLFGPIVMRRVLLITVWWWIWWKILVRNVKKENRPHVIAVKSHHPLALPSWSSYLCPIVWGRLMCLRIYYIQVLQNNAEWIFFRRRVQRYIHIYVCIIIYILYYIPTSYLTI